MALGLLFFTAAGGGEEERLRSEARRLLEPFRLTFLQKRELWKAFRLNPEGVERVALRAKAGGERNGNTGAGLLLTMIRAGDHLLEPKPDTPIPTGWRFVRGSHSGTFVEDPEGTDRLPAHYSFAPSKRYVSPDDWEVADMGDVIWDELEVILGPVTSPISRGRRNRMARQLRAAILELAATDPIRFPKDDVGVRREIREILQKEDH